MKSEVLGAGGRGSGNSRFMGTGFDLGQTEKVLDADGGDGQLTTA